MKRYYEERIVIIKTYEIDEDEIREKCDIPEDEDIDEVCNEWIKSSIEEEIEDGSILKTADDIEFKLNEDFYYD